MSCPMRNCFTLPQFLKYRNPSIRIRFINPSVVDTPPHSASSLKLMVGTVAYVGNFSLMFFFYDIAIDDPGNDNVSVFPLQ